MQIELYTKDKNPISIHALRVEGDAIKQIFQGVIDFVFLSTPSGWRATTRMIPRWRLWRISIHALRVEGDTA